MEDQFVHNVLRSLSEEATPGLRKPKCGFRKRLATGGRRADMCAGMFCKNLFFFLQIKNPGLPTSAATAVTEEVRSAPPGMGIGSYLAPFPLLPFS